MGWGALPFQLLHGTWYPHPESYCGNSSRRGTSGLAHASGLNILKLSLCGKARSVISPSWWQMCHGVCKSSLILVSRWKPPSLWKWLTNSLQIPNVVFSLGLPLLLTAIGFLSFSPSTTSSARQDTALFILLGPVYRWGSAVEFWPFKSCSQAQLQHRPFYMVTHFLKIWETPSYMVEHVKMETVLIM